ncbi:hypothetical protein EJ06DRAFT_534331 [Trichodelitschia bisporula]|uniref:Methyltransferase n=1 Tax=Trichodelitschia bisporula TaxID=703511 RepID=A0A6G1HK12_9PEZI|nr:hypothetical protein EJ06DRAFT_534331 [Trichodelitschia bisporula]
MTTAVFKYLDPASYTYIAETGEAPWTKVDGGGTSFKLIDKEAQVKNIRGREDQFTTDTSGFAIHKSIATEKSFRDEKAVRESYYPEVEALLREKLPGVKKVIIFDHTIRRREKGAPRGPVQQVHVDQTQAAAEKRVFRHIPEEEAKELAKGRFQIINVWRPIENPASDFPLAVIDWRTTTESDFVPITLLYPKPKDVDANGQLVDDRGREALPDPNVARDSTEGYEAKGVTMGVLPNNNHKFYYVKDMTPEEALFIKCSDSRGQGLPQGVDGIARCTPHTAFVDPQTPADAPGRQSIEVRCLVFYE